ncbi:MAG: hypothetical protein LH630_06785 [Actinomycetia bacterium]|nr:hypothetical protein [Actinomycetes bacterium]
MASGGRLNDGQLVTLLVGLGLELRPLHEVGHAYGPIHPAHITVDSSGRPRLADVVPPPGWTPHDDWVALLRLARHVGESERAATLSWVSVAGEMGVRAERGAPGGDVLAWLMRWASPQPLPLWLAGRLISDGRLREVV